MLDVLDRPPTSIDEEELAERIRTLGKWRRPDVPHGGWICTSIEDLGSAAAICEMCEVATIRYVHTMRHPDWPEPLRCGCVCAGNMENDLAGARQRERRERNRAIRRRNHPKRLARFVTKEWRESEQGNQWCRVRGHRVVIYGVPPRALVEFPSGRVVRTRAFRTAREAKAAAFGLIFNDDGSLKEPADD